MQTLATSRFGLHEVEAPSLKNSAYRQQAPRTPAKGRKREEEKKSFRCEWGRRWNGKKTAFSNRPNHPIFRPPPTLKREFLLYLPLYNGIKALELGIPGSAHLEPAPVRPQKPIVFYGTSILQGGCASRPGMAYPAIIGRHLDWPTLNLGFSGNAISEPEVAQLLAELDPAAYVLDAVPNMTTAQVTNRIEPFVQALRQAHPKTPIVLVEEEIYTNAKFVQFQHERYLRNNAALKAAYARLRKAGVKNLYYIPADHLLGDDGEATVDGVHPTDLGFLRMAETIGPVLGGILK
jgi:lysophospholipase L1-like esterase